MEFSDIQNDVSELLTRIEKLIENNEKEAAQKQTNEEEIEVTWYLWDQCENETTVLLERNLDEMEQMGLKTTEKRLAQDITKCIYSQSCAHPNGYHLIKKVEYEPEMIVVEGMVDYSFKSVNWHKQTNLWCHNILVKDKATSWVAFFPLKQKEVKKVSLFEEAFVKNKKQQNAGKFESLSYLEQEELFMRRE